MVTWLGSDARRHAESIGLTQLFELAHISENEFRAAIRRFRTTQEQSVKSRPATVLATIDTDAVHFSQSDLIGLPKKIELMDERHVCRTVLSRPHKLDSEWAFDFEDPYDGWARYGLLTHSRGQSTFLCHHVAQIQRMARPGHQAQVRAVLLQLQSETPDLSGLIAVIEKVIFSEPDIVVSSVPSSDKTTETRNKKKTDFASTGIKTLEIPGSDERRLEARRRLLRSGDLAYLLDVLIRELGVGLAPRALPQIAQVVLKKSKSARMTRGLQLLLERS